MKSDLFMIALWRHECERVFCDKLVNNRDKEIVMNYINEITSESFGHLENEIQERLMNKDKYMLFCDFLREDDINEEGYIEQLAEKVYEAITDPVQLKKRCDFLLEQFN